MVGLVRKTDSKGLMSGSRKRTHCYKGHEYTPENTYYLPNGNGRTCKICLKESRKRWRSNNRDKVEAYEPIHKKIRDDWRKRNPDYQKNRDLQRQYGLSREDWQKMFDDQQGLCAICGDTMKRIVVDHDHISDKVRGLLCNNCNLGIGLLQDDSRILESAFKYLKKYEED
jgi:hypothetical protein